MPEKINADLMIEILDNIETGIHLVDAEGYTIYYNEAAEKVDGLKKEEVLGKSMYNLVGDGTFSRSVALDVIKERKKLEVTQKVNGRLVSSIGIPIIEGDHLQAVVVYTNDIQTLEVLSLQLNELKKANREMTVDLSKYKAEYLNGNQVLSKSKQMNKIVDLADKISDVDSTVLLEGESGVGKTMFARYIHDKSSRRNKPFVKVDCSAIPETLIESELFGYEEGSFTGSLKGGKDGFVVAARGGTLFLDEIAELPLSSQVKLLTLLQDKKISPVGSAEWIDVDIRVIAATNQNLEKLIEEGEFREDLYYRLKVIPITIPPLRDRKADIVPMIMSFTSRLNSYYEMDKSISPSGISVLLDYPWPGNVRELENVIERLMVTSEGDEITEEEVRFCLVSKEEKHTRKTYKEKVDEFEIKLIRSLSTQAESIKEMAEIADINESTLRKKIKRYDLNIEF